MFHMNGPNRFGAKSIGVGLRSHVNVVIVTRKIVTVLLTLVTIVNQYRFQISFVYFSDKCDIDYS